VAEAAMGDLEAVTALAVAIAAAEAQTLKVTT